MMKKAAMAGALGFGLLIALLLSMFLIIASDEDWSDVESCREDARRSWRSGTEPDVRQLRRIIRRREQTGRNNDRKGYINTEREI